MYKVLIIINAAQQVSHKGDFLTASPPTNRMMATLKEAITTANTSHQETIVKVIAAQQLLNETQVSDPADSDWIYCPLTIDLPPQFEFPRAKLFQMCRDISGTRQWVEDHLAMKTGNQIQTVWYGNYWLPIVLTEKGPMYGELIGEGQLPNSYQQPVPLSDHHRQALYYLGYQLLEAIAAQPAVYLLQFGFQDDQLIFDRIWPFPAAPALASVGIQEPNLYSCHWQCLTKQPIRDLVIA